MSLCALHAHAFGSLGIVYSLSGLCDSCLRKNELSMPNMMTLLLEQISSNSCNLPAAEDICFDPWDLYVLRSKLEYSYEDYCIKVVGLLKLLQACQ